MKNFFRVYIKEVNEIETIEKVEQVEPFEEKFYDEQRVYLLDGLNYLQVIAEDKEAALKQIQDILDAIYL